jgi:hypothetical protein
MKRKIFLALSALFTLAMMTVAMANPTPTIDTTQIVGDSLTVVSEQIFGIIGVVAPAAFIIMASIVGIKFGIRFVRSLIGR